VQPALGPLAQVREDRNHVVEHTVLKAGQSEHTLKGLTAADLSEKITYLDGLGRPVQQVSTQASPSGKDLVQPIAYDAFGREDKKYLPYPHLTAGDGRYKPGALTEQPSRYDALKNEGPAVAETRFEASPLSRVLEQGAPGTAWQLTDRDPSFGNANHSVKTATRTNLENEVRRWEYDFATGKATGNGFYGYDAVSGEGQLLVTEMMDEQDHLTLEYKDKEGRLVSKKVQDKADDPVTGTVDETTFATTSYVYDAFGLLRFVIPPQAEAELSSVGFTLEFGSDFAKRWLFAYRYDERGRMSEKRVPGADAVWLVYNGRDELILTQDGRQRQGYNSLTTGGQLEAHPGGEWSFSKYDALGRGVMNGLFRPGTLALSQAAMQERVEAIEATAPLFEKRESTGATLEGYSALAYPRPADGTLTPLSVSYYDDYSFPNASSLAFVPVTGFAQGHIADSKPAQLRGKATGGKTRLLGSAEWLHSVQYYDAYNRTIQTISENHAQSGSGRGKDLVTSHYDFAGKLLHSQTRHENPQAVGAKTRLVNTRSTYDHAGRVTGTYQQVDEGTEERLALLDYNELGEIDNKRLGKEALQQVDYGYNIRGWLRSINDARLATAANEPKDLFGMELQYNTATGGLYNGNIGKQSWMSHSDKVARSYAYSYDPMSRLLSASYSASLTGQSPQGATVGAFSLSNMQYDKNGNILFLTREGLRNKTAGTTPAGFGVVDQLTYRYDLSGTGKSNQLLSVIDGQADKTYQGGDFKDGVSQDLEYEYDQAGNLVKDLNKGISQVLYNHLNLPVEVRFADDRFIRYGYDASGTRRWKVSRDGTGSTPKQTDYLAGMVYEQDVLQFIPTAEGRALPPEGTGEAFFAYEYHYKDHLGNLRAAFRKAPAIAPFTATMEPASAPLEEAQFDNIARTRSSEHALNGPLTGTKHSARVGPMADGTRLVLGPWRTLSVKQGDRLQAQVYAYCPSPAPNDATKRVQLTAFVNPQATPATGEQTSNLWDKLKIGLSFPLASQATAPQDNSVPVAYLKYIFYDKGYNPVSDLIVPVTRAALAANGGWEGLSFDIVAAEEGYVQVLVANESDKAVWFDDLQIKHSPALIVQENHYDPWGLNLAGIEKQGQPDHKFQYNGKEKQEELGLGWIDYGMRNYDPQLGRWHSVDAMGEMTPELTPYRYAFNNPISFTDFMGLWERDANGNAKTDKQEDIERFMTFFQGQSAATGKNASLYQIDKFIGFEMAGGGDSYTLSNGTQQLFEGITIKGSLENNRWKTSSIEYAGMAEEVMYAEQKYFDTWGYGSTYSTLAQTGLQHIVTPQGGMFFGKNGKQYPVSRNHTSSLAGKFKINGASGRRIDGVVKTMKALDNVKALGKGLMIADVAMNLLELDYNGYSNRAFVKVGIAVGIGVAAALTGGVGGVALGFALGAFEAHGGFDGLYSHFTNDPRFSVTNSALDPQ